MKKTFTPYFMDNFYQRLLTPNGNNPVRNRADGFKWIFRHLDSRIESNATKHPNVGPFFQILETGSIRADHGELSYGDDGCSSVIFDSFVSQIGGSVTSVDIDSANVAYAKKHVSKNTTVHCADSVQFIYQIPPSLKFDVVYLDSFDIDRNNPHPSALHHLKELCAVLKNCKSGTIIAVDDCDAFFDGGVIGKGMYVRDFMENINAIQIHKGYQEIWML